MAKINIHNSLVRWITLIKILIVEISISNHQWLKRRKTYMKLPWQEIFPVSPKMTTMYVMKVVAERKTERITMKKMKKVRKKKKTDKKLPKRWKISLVDRIHWATLTLKKKVTKCKNMAQKKKLVLWKKKLNLLRIWNMYKMSIWTHVFYCWELHVPFLVFNVLLPSATSSISSVESSAPVMKTTRLLANKELSAKLIVWYAIFIILSLVRHYS